MKKVKVIRNYAFSDAILKQKADGLIRLLDRDLVEFAERGYDATAKLLFVEKVNVVDTFPSDEVWEASKMNATEEKAAARSALEKTMRTILNMASNHFGANSARFRAFGPSDLVRQRDAELVRACKIMVLAATTNLEIMEKEGLIQTTIDKLIAQGTPLDLSIDAVAMAIINRDIATEDRVEALNTLYRSISKYAGIGKDIFYETNEAKYNDYLIYDAPEARGA